MRCGGDESAGEPEGEGDMEGDLEEETMRKIKVKYSFFHERGDSESLSYLLY